MNFTPDENPVYHDLAGQSLLVAAHVTHPDSKLYNLETLRELDDEEYLVQILDIFLESTHQLMNSMKMAADHQNWTEVYKKAHTLKSNFGMLQINALFEIVATIEELSRKNENPRLVEQLISRSMITYGVVHATLANERNEIQTRVGEVA